MGKTGSEVEIKFYWGTNYPPAQQVKAKILLAMEAVNEVLPVRITFDSKEVLSDPTKAGVFTATVEEYYTSYKAVKFKLSPADKWTLRHYVKTLKKDNRDKI